jgi:hypothetical protein
LKRFASPSVKLFISSPEQCSRYLANSGYGRT